MCPNSTNGEHSFERDQCLHCGETNPFIRDKETAEELLVFLSHQFVSYKYTRVHELIKRLEQFIGQK